MLNVQQGLYNGAPLAVSSNTVLVGAPAAGSSASAGNAELDDAAAGGGAAVPVGGSQGSGSSSRRAAPAALPLEILAQGDFEPVYRSPLDVRNGELPVLPLSIYGAGGAGGGKPVRLLLRSACCCCAQPAGACCQALPRLPPSKWHAQAARLPSNPCALPLCSCPRSRDGAPA